VEPNNLDEAHAPGRDKLCGSSSDSTPFAYIMQIKNIFILCDATPALDSALEMTLLLAATATLHTLFVLAKTLSIHYNRPRYLHISELLVSVHNSQDYHYSSIFRIRICTFGAVYRFKAIKTSIPVQFFLCKQVL
jgi:hypothetical protein